MSLRDSYFNGPSGIQQQMDGAFAAGVAYIGVGANDSSVLDLGDRNGSNLSRGSGMPGAYFTYATPSSNYAMWIAVNGQEIAPTVAGAILVQVDITNTDNGVQAASAIAAAMNAAPNTPFSAASYANIVSMSPSAVGVVLTPISIGTLDYTPATFTGIVPGTSSTASYTGTLPGTATSVTLTADAAGTAGNSITLTFTGSNTIYSAVSMWNTANPSNIVLLTSGDGTQVPSAGSQSLSGGVNGTPIVLTANFAGPNGASIILTFTGSNTISQAINTWNTANPLNSVTLTSGNGTQIPTTSTLQLSGGDAGTATVSQNSPGIAPTGNFSTLQTALTSAAAQGLTDFRVMVQGTGSGNAAYLRYRNGSNQYLGAFFAGIRYALAGENIYDYQCGLTLDISMNSSTNVIFSFHFGSRIKKEHVNLEPLTTAFFNPNDLGFDIGFLPI